jgi:hypothetical protein
VVTITLAPGETALLTLDRAAEPATSSPPTVIETVVQLPEWAITVESWDAGDLQVITEDRGLGYETREVRPTTAITAIDAGTGALRPWKDIPEVGPAVSGVGEYTATLSLVGTSANAKRYLLDLGSTAGGLGAVRVNRGAPKGFDTSHPIVDITNDLRAGDNEVTIRVASSLNNRLLARGYYERIVDIGLLLAGKEPGTQRTNARAYGLLEPRD